MKALLLSDEISQFHWAMLKSVLLILSLLPISQFFINLWQSADATSQIMIGFMAMSVFSALMIISFYNALNLTVVQLKTEFSSLLEQQLVKVYRYVPMLSLAAMLSYLVTQFENLLLKHVFGSVTVLKAEDVLGFFLNLEINTQDFPFT